MSIFHILFWIKKSSAQLWTSSLDKWFSVIIKGAAIRRYENNLQNLDVILEYFRFTS